MRYTISFHNEFGGIAPFVGDVVITTCFCHCGKLPPHDEGVFGETRIQLDVHIGSWKLAN